MRKDDVMNTKESACENGRSFPPYSEHPAILSRRRYPQESRYPWLPILLDSYVIADYERQLDIKNEMARRGEDIACHKACFNCCTSHEIPITAFELTGISWYYSEVCEADIRKQIKPRLLNHNRIVECPFLLNTICSIYPVRPLACRDFFVFGNPCKKGEDPFVTRPHDMLPINRDVSKYVALRFLDFPAFDCSTMEKKQKAFHEGIIVNSRRPMHELDWTEFVKRADMFDGEREN